MFCGRHTRGYADIGGQDVGLPYVVRRTPRFEEYVKDPIRRLGGGQLSRAPIRRIGTKLHYDLVPMLATRQSDYSPVDRSRASRPLGVMEVGENVNMVMKSLMYWCAALALAGGWLLAGSAMAQPTQPANPPGTTSGPAAGTPPTPTMPATRHQTEVLRGNPKGKPHNTRTTARKPATVHQQQVLRNLQNNPSAHPTH